MHPLNRNNSRGIVAGWPILVVIGFVALFLLRGWVVENHYGEVAACSGCFFWPAVGQDFWILSLAVAMLLAVQLLPWRWASRVAGAGVAILFLMYLADVYILHTFGIRLFLADVALYGLNLSLILEQLTGWAGGYLPTIALALLLLGIAGAPVLLPRARSVTVNALLAGIFLVSVAVGSLASTPDYVNNWIYSNFLQANAHTTESVPYSTAESERLIDSYRERFPDRCASHDIDRRKVIVLAVESWSSYHSKAFGGHLDWTPRLDELARDFTRYSRVHAGGFSTNEGLVNLLGGVRLWAPFQHLFEAAEFGYAWDIERSLPSVFNEAGFQTVFLTTGPLGFLSKGEWLANLGFDYIEGNEHPFYSDWPRVAFHAAADEALYRRALEWLDNDADSPFLLVLETVSTHPPYVDPESGEFNIERTFRYADAWAHWFYRQLRERGFFDDGVLLVTSDHRTMTPIGKPDHERFGLAAASRIPLVVVDDRLPGARVIDRVHGLGDIVPSFVHRLEGSICLDSIQASLFESAEVRNGCALHLRGDQRGMVDAFCQDGHGQVRLEGDDTRFEWHEGLDTERRQAILQVIAVERAAGLRREAGRAE